MLTAISHSIQHNQVGRLMQNHVSFNEFILSQHRRCAWAVLAPKLWDGLLNCCMTACPNDRHHPRERPAYSEGLHSCVASGETGNYIKSVSTEQFVEFCWIDLSTRDQAFAPGSATSSPYSPNPLLWLGSSSAFLSLLYMEVTGVLGQEPTLHPRRFSSRNWMKPWAAWSDLRVDCAVSRRLDQRPPEVPSSLSYPVVLWFTMNSTWSQCGVWRKGMEKGFKEQTFLVVRSSLLQKIPSPFLNIWNSSN